MRRTITALQAQKRNPQRINVYLDGEFAFGLERIVAAWLSIGQELSEEKITALQTDDTREVVYQKTLRLLDHRDRSQAELEQKLHQYGLNDDMIASIIERLRSSGLLDDHRFARGWTANRSEFRPRGRRALAYELRQKGIQQDVIQQTLENLDEIDLAYQAAKKQARRLSQLDWQGFRQKMFAFLARRGFDFETSTTVTRRVWAELQPVEQAEHTDHEEEP